MMDEKMIAPCGMNCGLCVSFQFGASDLNKEGFNKKYCSGCVPRGENCTFMDKHCDLIGQGQVRFCFECEDYPCKRLKALDKRYRSKHHLSMIQNLNTIRDFGMDYFLETEINKWKCPDCGELICCHNGLCLNCQLDILKFNKKYRWGE